ncbi:MAG: phosphoribosylglycinamide formyltransferase [bacterium]|nr:phosphoribosylglycinamide formyltransferase [bacterium]
MPESKRARLAVFISGKGSDMQAIIDASKRNELDADVVWVVSNTRKALGLDRAKEQGIDTSLFNAKEYGTPSEAGGDLVAHLKKRQIDYVVMAGYLKLMPSAVLKAFPNRVVNIHPGILPQYGGPGMYGHFVHEAVLAAKEKESGCTVHLADEIYDHGRILEQVRVPVLEGDTPDTLAARVLQQEHLIYPKALQKLIKGEYSIHE